MPATFPGGTWQTIATKVTTELAQDVDFAVGIRGDEWRFIKITIDLFGNSADHNGSLQPNALATNQVATAYGVSNSAGGDAQYADMRLTPGAVDSANNGLLIVLLRPRTGRNRTYLSEFYGFHPAIANGHRYMIGGEWQETVTGITSLRYHSDQANSIGIGSSFLTEGINF